VTAPRVVLVGPPGAGKSTVGRVLAEALGVGFRDTDADIEAEAGKTIADIFFDDGEEHFRALERAAVARALTEHDGVLALGGGAVLAEETRQALKEHHVVFLNVGLGPAAKRVGLARDRPVLALNPRASLHQLMEKRLPLYREVAQLEVVTDDKTPEQVVKEITA
jgi:shikimate kinase